MTPGQATDGAGRSRLSFAEIVWSADAAIRAVRAMVIIPGLFALCLEVFGNPQLTVYASFGSFGALVLTSLGGTVKDKAIAYAGLALAGGAALTIGTIASGTAWLAALVSVPVVFAISFAADVAGPNAASGVTAALLAYVLPVASAGSAGDIPARFAGWLLACAVSAAGVLLLSPRTPGDQLRQAAAHLARARRIPWWHPAGSLSSAAGRVA